VSALPDRSPSRHARRLVRVDASLPRTVDHPVRVVVVGGGVAGAAAALLLAERGVRVTLVERGHRLGGRLAAWPKRLADGSDQMIDHLATTYGLWPAPFLLVAAYTAAGLGLSTLAVH
jgi:heterodisulfide reductase subunit A-like polyferredoxin